MHPDMFLAADALVVAFLNAGGAIFLFRHRREAKSILHATVGAAANAVTAFMLSWSFLAADGATFRRVVVLVALTVPVVVWLRLFRRG